MNRIGTAITRLALASILFLGAQESLADLLATHHWMVVGPRDIARNPRLGDLTASPSPDGKTIILTARLNPRDGVTYSASWLLDAGTGKIRRVGARTENCVFTIWHDDPASWSPAGRWLRLYTTPAKHPEQNGWDAWLAQMEELIIDTWADSAKVVRRRGGFRCHWSAWLGNGTNVDWTPSAWEFTDLATGKTQRCLHSPEGELTDRVGRRAWLEDAVLVASFDKAEDGKARLQVWRSAPGLSATTRREFPVDPALGTENLHPWAISPDGHWLLAIPRAKEPAGKLGLFSLRDGSGRLLAPEDGCDLDRPLFTVDSSRLVVPSLRSIQVWNLATGQWEAKTKLPDSFSTGESRPGKRRFRIALSPKPPWRLAVSADDEPAVHLANLQDATLTEVFAVPIQEGYGGRGRRLLWLGNDRLLLELGGPYELWTVQSDGSDRRRVLP